MMLETVKEEKPETTQQLIPLMEQRRVVPPEETTKPLTELENENRPKSTKPQTPIALTLKAHAKPRNKTKLFEQLQQELFWKKKSGPKTVPPASLTHAADEHPKLTLSYYAIAQRIKMGKLGQSHV